MTDLRKAAEMALEFVEWLCGDDHSVKPKNNALKTREALRQALAQPEQEPVAWINYNAATGEETINRDCHSELASTPLYTAPPRIEAAVSAEREACAKVVEEWLHGDWHNQGVVAAAMIRARGEK